LKSLSLLFILTLSLWGGSVAEAYPSYRYVFSEFDIDPSFIENQEFGRFVKKNEKKIKHFYRRSIERGTLLLPILQKKLMDDGLSDLLIYLSMVESGFSVNAVSSKKAVGLWQFMPATAQAHHLLVCESVDERCDPESATDAAIDYLRQLHRRFGKWYLAMMAYNCGEGRMAKAIKRVGTDTLSVLIEKETPLPTETKRYIQKILLAAMIGESIAIEFDQMPKEKGKNGLMRVYVNGAEQWSVLAELLDMQTSELKKLNPAYPKERLPDAKDHYGIYIPEEKIYAFYLRYDANRHSKIFQTEYMLPYDVRLGDTLEKIAAQFHSDVNAIKKANHMNHSYLEVGRLLVIPVKKAVFDRLQSESSE
jgi:membrane-bound lytic murein transglycosylase D